MAALARVPAALWVLLIVAVGLRVAVWVTYSPAAVNLADSLAYVGSAGGDLFSDATRTVGYPLFLRAVHSVSAQLEFTIFLQHALGIAAGLLLYATVRRLGAPVWVGLLACAGVVLPIDQIFLEHAIMNETLFLVLVTVAAYAAVRALDERRELNRFLTTRHAWLIAASAALALAAWARSVGLLMVPLIAVWALFAISGTWRARLANGAVALAAGAVVLLGYAALQSSETGSFGFSRSSGWAIYSRTAPFADCTRFDPPAGGEALCETTPPEQRNGPDFYGQQPDSPARQLFGAPPNGDEILSEFGRSAIMAQPFSYAKAVGRDLVRYFDPNFSPQAFSGVGYDVLAIDRRAGGIETEVNAALNGYYADDTIEIDGATATLADVQSAVRVHPKLLAAALILAVAGLFCGAGRARAGLVLLALLGIAMLAIPPLTVIWTSRYAVPAQGFVLGAGAIGLWLVATRIIEWRERSAPEERSEPAPGSA